MNPKLRLTMDQIKPNLVGRGSLFLSMLLLTCLALNAKEPQKVIQFIYTSDTHLGIKRLTFRGDSNVYSNVVNTAMVEKMNGLSKVKLPEDGGVNGGNLVDGIDYLINTGDIANRSDFGTQSATISWNQFTSIYLNGITLKNGKNGKTAFLLLPGNHDISNAIGFHKKMEPLTDNTSLVSIYNYMFPQHPKTSTTYNYKTDKVHYSKNISGIHFVFINMWPDSSERIWLTKDLKEIDHHTPVILFAHDQPTVESKHFTNPNGLRTINSTDKFENLLVEVFKDGQKITDPSQIEQRSFVAFLKLHPNIKAYFNGNENENKMYEYKGPDSNIALKTFQVDSPMKGNVSSKDETKLSFQVVSIDPEAKTMTVRECLWNTNPKNPSADVVWGTHSTISLAY